MSIVISFLTFKLYVLGYAFWHEILIDDIPCKFSDLNKSDSIIFNVFSLYFDFDVYTSTCAFLFFFLTFLSNYEYNS